uniref:McrB family protein n=1 Tax=Candidatus Cryptobacteroides bacterium TaxID=3085639 RepID=UPI004026C643
MDSKFTWVPLYEELAQALLRYKEDRTDLVEWIYEDLGKVTRADGQSLVAYLKQKDGSRIIDIDPFSVFAIFNRSTSWENRTKLLTHFKKKFRLTSTIPSDFNGIPTVDARRSFFFSWKSDNSKVIHDLWQLFEKVISDHDISEAFDQVLENGMPKYSLTMCLFWICPEKYLALDSRNRSYLESFGFPNEFPKFNYDEYSNLLAKVQKKINNGDIPCSSFLELSLFAWKTATTTPNVWLVGYTFSDSSQFDRFVENSIWEGHFNDNSTNDQKLLTLATTIKKGDILILKSTSTKGAKHDQPFLRVKAVAVVLSDVNSSKNDGYTSCVCNVQYYGIKDSDFDNPVLASYRKTIHLADDKAKPLVDYANSLINPTHMPQLKYKEYIDLLTEAHNLVFTGAPGTGKTHMAQAIAEEMGAVTKFVQFHPSYDYTDFVEGLRPIEKGDGQLGFERKDGVFKEFCREAIKNLIDSEKSIESLTKEMSWQEKLDRFVEDSIEEGTKFKTVNGSEFIISEIKNHSIVIHNEQNEKTTQVAVNADEILELLTNEVPLNIVRDIRNYFSRKFGTQPDSYAFVIAKAIRAMRQKMPVVEANKIDRKPFVFIIDEINRGEASKIFGELFYAIDPGYRGKKDYLVQTQYQNLVPETDIFAKGFYVPENVYILATMNDIDRSVESMDFAMRRRFTWKEVTPTDTEAMLDALPCAKEAKATMNRLNNAIEETDGLGAAYMIGPSYFLKLGENGCDFLKLWKMNIEPLLKEYLRGFRKADEIIDRFNKSYFSTKEDTATDQVELIDED